MRTSITLLPLLFAASARALPSLSGRSLSTIAGCATECFEDVNVSNACPGKFTDACVCKNQVILAAFNKCVAKTCVGMLKNIDQAVYEVCLADGITITMTDPLAERRAAPTSV